MPWWESVDPQQAAIEPENGPEWIEMWDGTWKKPEYFTWDPDQWHFYGSLCNYNKPVLVDKAHIASRRHQRRILFNLQGDDWCDVVDYPNIKRIHRNWYYDFWNPHKLGPTTALENGPEAQAPPEAGGPPRHAFGQRAPPTPGLHHHDIEALTEAVRELTVAVHEVKTIIHEQGAAMREFTAAGGFGQHQGQPQQQGAAAVGDQPSSEAVESV